MTFIIAGTDPLIISPQFASPTFLEASKRPLDYAQQVAATGGDIMFIMDMPYLAMQDDSMSIAQAYLDREPGNQEPLEKELDLCKEVGNSHFYANSAFNSLALLPEVLPYLGYHWSAAKSAYNVPQRIRESIRSGILRMPTHGNATIRDPVHHGYAYQARPGYEGPDEVVFWVEADKKRFKITYKLSVVSAVDENSTPVCESVTSNSTIIDELTTNSVKDDALP